MNNHLSEIDDYPTKAEKYAAEARRNIRTARFLMFWNIALTIFNAALFAQRMMMSKP